MKARPPMASAVPLTLAEFFPILEFSTLSAQSLDCRAASFSRPISFLSRSFCDSSKASCRRLFSYHEEKFPFCTSMLLRLMDRM